MIGLVASIVEAFGELRVNKGRVLLSLIGVAFSVFAMTAVLGGGQMLSGALQQSIERQAGRPTVLTVQPTMSAGGATAPADPAVRDGAVLDGLERLGITYRSRSTSMTLRIQTRQGVRQVQTYAVDPSYAEMYRVRVEDGRWIAHNDASRLAPVVVIDDQLHRALGRPPLGSGTLTAYGENDATVQMTIIGVLPATAEEAPYLTAFMSAGALSALPGDPGQLQTSYLAWVPPEHSEEIREQLAVVLRDTPAGSFEAYQSGMSVEDMGFRQVEYGVLGVAAVILALGGLGLVNISLVTVRFRMREIGIRRSYGATGLRVFVGVLMESVVATVVAGLLGVTAAVALVRAPFVQEFFRDLGLVDLPPFPVSAVLIGLLAATLVGALAGIIPALIATRIKVIDAIRA